MSENDLHIDLSDLADSPPLARSGATIVLLHCIALFLGSLLLFAIEPMFTKMILPLLGGTPAVWNTAMMFFQGVLLIGYLYAHLLSRIQSLRRQAVIHAGVLTAGLLFLPVHVAWQQAVATSEHPVPWLVALLAVSIGMPFFAVSATAPLLQRWFSRSDHPQASDPYFLYASSNAGGLIALLTYPVLVEPWLGLTLQSWAWTAGYVVLAVTILLCAASLWIARRRLRLTAAAEAASEIEIPDIPDTFHERISWSRRARWVALAFVPSALLLAVTQHISTDVAAAPFLWVVPLSLYLLSFIIVFSRRPILKHGWMLWLQVWVLALLAVYFTEHDLWLVLSLHMATLFLTAMVCHGELVRRRPTAEHLTEFYLWMSFGGLLGGVFCSLIAPAAFNSILEYPLILALACLLRPEFGRGGSVRRLLDLALPALLTALYLHAWKHWPIFDVGPKGPILFYGATAITLFSFHNRPLRLTLGFAAILFTTIHFDDMKRQLYRERSFFGLYTVCTNRAGNEHWLYNGNILHGDQCMDPNELRTPRTYYIRGGPLWQIFEAMNERGILARVGVIGLGTGCTSCYHQPGRTMTFFEVDPTMERIARNPRLFRYLETCGEGVDVVIGDGRQNLARAADGSFDLLILDAFSSDAIPVHLLTREALALYMRKLSPHGVALLHISNKYLDLAPVVANLVADAALAGRIQEHEPSEEEARTGASASTWVAVTRDPRDLDLLAPCTNWSELKPDRTQGVWTDDYSNVFRTLLWGHIFRRQ
ncbi:MAG: fused MFS/spermidine synthase [Solirubrobacterales bacterium]